MLEFLLQIRKRSIGTDILSERNGTGLILSCRGTEQNGTGLI